jgi:hypothetical protein
MPEYCRVQQELEGLKAEISALGTLPERFDALALKIFQVQFTHCRPYRNWCEAIGWGEVDVARAVSAGDPRAVPHLPVQAFKYADVLTPTGSGKSDLVFETSGTTSTRKGTPPGRHIVLDPALYLWSLLEGFQRVYGPPSDWCILALLPDYLERKNASLVHMVSALHDESKHPMQGFFLSDTADLLSRAREVLGRGDRVMILGVTHALLGLAEQKPALPVAEKGQFVVVETGGMKGRRKELLRPAVHTLLRDGLPDARIDSEYGMTEMLSQGWACGGGMFEPPKWLRAWVRRPDDPFTAQRTGRTGGLNFIDLANLHSCSFLSTQDLGRVDGQGCFEVLGRFKDSEVRGCNLLTLES